MVRTHVLLGAGAPPCLAVFEELFYRRTRAWSSSAAAARERVGTAFATSPAVRNAIKQVLPFHPTAAQKRVLGEIVADMRRPQPMRRLLQGDVGSGKTISSPCRPHWLPSKTAPRPH